MDEVVVGINKGDGEREFSKFESQEKETSI